MRPFPAQRGAVSTPRSTSGATAPRGKVGVGGRQVVASPRSNAAMGSGTAPRRGRTRRDAEAAVPTSLRVEWWDRGWWHPATLPAGRCVTRSRSGATTSCTVQTAATRGTAPCASRAPSIVTVTGQCVSVSLKTFRFEVLFLLWRRQRLIEFQCLCRKHVIKIKVQSISWKCLLIKKHLPHGPYIS